jgi:hypothetical protein
MSSELLYLVGIDFAIQIVGALFAIAFRTEKFYDLAGSSTFVILTLSSLWFEI